VTVDSAAPAEIMALAAAIGKVLAGHPAPLQGAALADCLAMWLAGHVVPGNENATRKMRAEMLAMHCDLVRELVPENAKLIGTTP
jgi:hypothetical protein